MYIENDIFIFSDMYRRHESLISQVTKTADDVPMIVTRLASMEKNDIDYYPFSQVLRIRVLQVIYIGSGKKLKKIVYSGLKINSLPVYMKIKITLSTYEMAVL
jgi:hypothetical protein